MIVACKPQVLLLAQSNQWDRLNEVNSNAEPKLARPGAGLPKVELYLARLRFALQCRTGNRDSFNARVQKERKAIRDLAGSCTSESAARRVLVERPPGLEDSSRYWSVWMTLDHFGILQKLIPILSGE